MKKTIPISHPLNRSQFLSVKNDWYKGVLLEFWEQQKKWDLHQGTGNREQGTEFFNDDITVEVLFGDQKISAKALITAKSNGVLAGREEAEFFLDHEGINFHFFCEDGELVTIGDVILEITGEAKKLLKIERILLNFLSRLSGIATLAKSAIEIIPKSVLLCPTRKTLWGPIDKKGVAVVGGGTHRLGLFDAVLVKENHLAMLENGIVDAVTRITNSGDMRLIAGDLFWEIEVESEQEFHSVLDNLPCARPGVIMLDNFSPSEIQELLIPTFGKNNTHKNCRSNALCLPGRPQGIAPTINSSLIRRKELEGVYIEESGGITLENIAEFAKTGVSAISCGFLTNAVIPVDFSMRMEC